jgi:hypothetical protein
MVLQKHNSLCDRPRTCKTFYCKRFVHLRVQLKFTSILVPQWSTCIVIISGTTKFKSWVIHITNNDVYVTTTHRWLYRSPIKQFDRKSNSIKVNYEPLGQAFIPMCLPSVHDNPHNICSIIIIHLIGKYPSRSKKKDHLMQQLREKTLKNT